MQARRGHGSTQYLYGSLSNPFQVTASRAPDNTLTVYYYDDYNALYALERGGVRYYVGSDHLGTPKVITDNTGAIVRQVEYDSWGVKTSDTNPGFDLPVGFAGGIPDDATGMVRFGFRDYEPGTGRWTAKDPIFFYGGQGNLFQYVGNSPVNYVDPNGECIPPVIAAAVIGTGLVIWGIEWWWEATHPTPGKDLPIGPGRTRNFPPYQLPPQPPRPPATGVR